MKLTAIAENLEELRKTLKRHKERETVPSALVMARMKDLTGHVLKGPSTEVFIDALDATPTETEGAQDLTVTQSALDLIDAALAETRSMQRAGLQTADGAQDLQRMVSIAIFENKFVRWSIASIAVAYFVAGGLYFYASYEVFGKAGAIGELAAEVEQQVEQAADLVDRAKAAENDVAERVATVQKQVERVENDMGMLSASLTVLGSRLEARMSTFDRQVESKQFEMNRVADGLEAEMDERLKQFTQTLQGHKESADSELEDLRVELAKKPGAADTGIEKILADAVALSNERISAFDTTASELQGKLSALNDQHAEQQRSLDASKALQLEREEQAKEIFDGADMRLDALLDETSENLNGLVTGWFDSEKVSFGKTFSATADAAAGDLETLASDARAKIENSSSSQQTALEEVQVQVTSIKDQLASLDQQKRRTESQLGGIALFTQDLQDAEDRINRLRLELAGVQENLGPAIALSETVISRGGEVANALENAMAQTNEDIMRRILARIETSWVLMAFGAGTLLLFFFTWFVIYRSRRSVV